MKLAFFIYFYSFCQFFIALKTPDINPKYLYTVFGVQNPARWKFVPLALLECYMSTLIASGMLFYVIFYLAYVKITKTCLEIVE